MKISAILFLMLIANKLISLSDNEFEHNCPGSLLASHQSCFTCGHECAPACGTRRYRLCCFNYLRKKRGPDMMQILYKYDEDLPEENIQQSKLQFLNEV
ncbi:unnamed protein product [Euphydryas editha]|uniref:Trissin n=1 Tax=Euphydryas editha TaxID=104508 RepID=A0AAU9USF7_EUPED|nr:unnamed protein product [Euphydryas editha]